MSRMKEYMRNIDQPKPLQRYIYTCIITSKPRRLKRILDLLEKVISYTLMPIEILQPGREQESSPSPTYTCLKVSEQQCLGRRTCHNINKLVMQSHPYWQRQLPNALNGILTILILFQMIQNQLKFKITNQIIQKYKEVNEEENDSM